MSPLILGAASMLRCSTTKNKVAAPLSHPLFSPDEIEYAADTALDHMAVMDENESPVEISVTKT